VKAYGEALKVLDHGLALQPDNPVLVSEKGAALAVQRRFAEALSLYDDWFARQGGPEDTPRYARLLRARGFALIELKRLDEAEAAYRQALEIEPDNAGAKHELAYIAELRAGQAGPKAIGLFRSDEAAKKAPD
jgi:Flp pilus assembly protein TadD